MTENQFKTDPNFMEISSVEDANRVDLSLYSFVKFSDSRNCYIFKKRAKV